MKIDENGVLYSVERSDVVNRTLIVPEGVKKIEWKLNFSPDTEKNERSTYIAEVAEITENVILPNTLTEIGYETFKNFKNLNKIIMPDSVTQIGDYAFENCESARQIKLSRNLEKIPRGTFAGCNMDFLIIPDSVKGFSLDAFHNFESSESKGKTNINFLRFPKKMENLNIQNMYNLEIKNTLILPKTVERFNLSNYAQHIEIIFPSKCDDNGGLLPYYRNSLLEGKVRGATFRSKKVYNDLTMGKYDKLEYTLNMDASEAFSEFQNKTNKIKNNIKIENYPVCRKELGMSDIGKIGYEATHVVVDGVDSIGEFAFSECDNLEEVIISEGVKVIERGAFAFCHNLKRVELPKSLITIGGMAFIGCESLKQVTIKSDLDRIGDQAFSGCENLKYVNSIGNIKTIDEKAFEGCKQLNAFIIKNGPDIIEDEAFKECKSLIIAPLYKGLKHIGKESFFGCENLLSINIPEGVEQIGECAFKNCCSVPQYYEIPIPSKEKNEVEMKKVEIPNMDVIVSIPKTVEEIGEGAFLGCKNIVYIHMMDGCQVKEIKQNTFAGCENLQTFDMSSEVENICEGAFKDCSSLTNISCIGKVGLPKKLKEIKSYAFENCGDLRLIVTDGNVKKEYDSFENTNGVKEANLENLDINVKRINNKTYDVIGPIPSKKPFSINAIKKSLSKFKDSEQK